MHGRRRICSASWTRSMATPMRPARMQACVSPRWRRPAMLECPLVVDLEATFRARDPLPAGRSQRLRHSRSRYSGSAVVTSVGNLRLGGIRRGALVRFGHEEGLRDDDHRGECDDDRVPEAGVDVAGRRRRRCGKRCRGHRGPPNQPLPIW